jgi:hypothetical protein
MLMFEEVEKHTSLCPWNVFLESPFGNLAGKLALSVTISAFELLSVLR